MKIVIAGISYTDLFNAMLVPKKSQIKKQSIKVNVVARG